MSEEMTDNPFKSPLVPQLLGPEHRFKFNCHKGISCFNACCKQADITLTPYDIIRLKEHLGISATEVLKNYTVPAEMDGHGLPAIKMRTQDEQPVCVFMREGEGCGVYTDRPSACRYYPVGLLNMRTAGSPTDEQHYFLVKEDHCKGHEEDREISIADYRTEQGVEEYDAMNREWYQILLKKRSSGPAVGKPSDTSLQFFFMCSYDMDRFRRFVMSDSFKKTYDMDENFFAEVEKDDVALMKFGFRFMKQVFFGEMTIPEKKGIYEQRLEERKEVLELRRQYEIELASKREEEAKRDAT